MSAGGAPGLKRGCSCQVLLPGWGLACWPQAPGRLGHVQLSQPGPPAKQNALQLPLPPLLVDYLPANYSTLLAPPPSQLRLLRVHGPIHHGCGHCRPARHAGARSCAAGWVGHGCRATGGSLLVEAATLRSVDCNIDGPAGCEHTVLPPVPTTTADGRPQPDRQARQLGSASAAGAGRDWRGGDARAGGTCAAAGGRHPRGQAHARG